MRAAARTKRTPDGATVHSFRTLRAALETICRKEARAPAHPDIEHLRVITTPTRRQQELFRQAGAQVTSPGGQRATA